MIRDVVQAKTPDEIRQIQRLRHEIYIIEQRKAYPAAERHDNRLHDKWDDVSEHFYLTEQSRYVAAVRYTPASVGRKELLRQFNVTDEMVEGLHDHQLSFTSRLVVEPSARRCFRSLFALLIRVYEHGVKRGAIVNLIHTDLSLKSFLERLGLRPFGQPFLFCPTQRLHQPMLLLADDSTYFEQCRSPFLKISIDTFAGKRVKISEAIQQRILKG